jgi:hypothetical protein
MWFEKMVSAADHGASGFATQSGHTIVRCSYRGSLNAGQSGRPARDAAVEVGGQHRRPRRETGATRRKSSEVIPGKREGNTTRRDLIARTIWEHSRYIYAAISMLRLLLGQTQVYTARTVRECVPQKSAGA